MELALKHNLKVDIGDVIYYINTGTAKSHSDIKAVKNKEAGTTEVHFNCLLIPQEQIESNPDMLMEDYNVAKYLEALNSRIEPLLVCFDPEIRNKILISVEKDKKTKLFKLQQRSVFTESECKLVAGKPIEPGDQDDYQIDLMTMEDREIKFWLSVDKLPNFMDEQDWKNITEDYIERMRIAKENGIRDEIKEIINLFKRLEVKDYNRIRNYGKLPLAIDALIDFDDNNNVVSRKWGEVLFDSSIMFQYENESIERSLWYSQVEQVSDNMYEMWLDYKAEIRAMSGDTIEKELRDLGSAIYNEEVYEAYEEYMNEEFPPSEDKTSIDDGNDWNF
jgi:hypothetical protein